MTPVIEFLNVSKQFTLDGQRPRSFQETFVDLLRRTPRHRAEAFWALRAASFRIEAGESVALVGANGSGKSTALKLISRIILPSEGSVTVKGRVAALLELGAGFHPDLSGRENIELNGAILGLDRAFIRKQMERIISFAELERFIDVPVRNYSSGMTMRLGFSVATALQPDILLIDEVLAVGDQAFQDRCLRRIRDIQENGATIVLVSHDLGSVRQLCQRAVWLADGRVRADGPTEEVSSAYLEAVWTVEQAREEDQQPVDFEENAATSTDPGCDGDATPASGRPHIARWGSGEVRITRVELLELNGTPKEVFRTDEGFMVRMWYHASRQVLTPAFGISLYDMQGNRINGPNTVWSDLPLPSIMGDGHVDYIVDALPLLPGRYDLTAAVYDQFVTHPYDHWHRMTSFVVISDGRERQDGVVFIPCRWAHYGGPEVEHG